MPAIPDTLTQFTYAEVNILIAILIWLMIYPMMVQIDFSSVPGVRRQPKGNVQLPGNVKSAQEFNPHTPNARRWIRIMQPAL